MQNSITADVAIVGAGPGGAIAAHRLASDGANVVLMERKTFPRDKVCGDGVSGDGLAVLARTGLEQWASQFTAPKALRLTAPDGQVVDTCPKRMVDQWYGRTIPRRLLDARLAQTAVEVGARLLENTRAQHVERSADGGIHVTADGMIVAAQLLILADGSNAPLTRRMGLVSGPSELIAVRQYLAGDAGPSDRLEIHFQRWITPGYAWIFPLQDGRANVGTGTFARHARHRSTPALKEVLQRFATNGRLRQAEAISPIRGYPLRTQFGRTRTHAERTLVVGDAAGLVSPLTGEGIAAAMESGEMAARHALRALESGDFSAQALAPYTRALRARYGADHRAARVVRMALMIPSLVNRVFRKLRRDDDVAREVGYVIIGHKSPRHLLRPCMLLRLMT